MGCALVKLKVRGRVLGSIGHRLLDRMAVERPTVLCAECGVYFFHKSNNPVTAPLKPRSLALRDPMRRARRVLQSRILSNDLPKCKVQRAATKTILYHRICFNSAVGTLYRTKTVLVLYPVRRSACVKPYGFVGAARTPSCRLLCVYKAVRRNYVHECNL